MDLAVSVKFEAYRVITFVNAKPIPADKASHSALLLGNGKAPSCQNMVNAPINERIMTATPRLLVRSLSQKCAMMSVQSGDK